MQNDAQLLAGIPEFLSIGSMLKATPQMDGGQRIVYFEASNEGLDQQGEVIAAKALAEIVLLWRASKIIIPALIAIAGVVITAWTWAKDHIK